MTIFDAIRRDRDAGTPGEWGMHRGHSDWGMPRRNAIMPEGVSEFDFEKMIAEVHSQTPYCLGASQKVANQSETADANARRIARVPELERIALVAEELASALTVQHEEIVLTPECVAALAAFRKAAGGE